MASGQEPGRAEMSVHRRPDHVGGRATLLGGERDDAVILLPIEPDRAVLQG